MSHPAGWFSWSSDQQRAWAKENRERQDAEYEREEAVRRSERAERERSRLRVEYVNEMNSAQEQRERLCEDLHEANTELRYYARYLLFKELGADFEAWKETAELEEMDD